MQVITDITSLQKTKRGEKKTILFLKNDQSQLTFAITFQTYMIFFKNPTQHNSGKVCGTKCFPTSHTSVCSFPQLILLLLVFAFYSIEAGLASFSFARAYRWLLNLDSQELSD